VPSRSSRSASFPIRTFEWYRTTIKTSFSPVKRRFAACSRHAPRSGSAALDTREYCRSKNRKWLRSADSSAYPVAVLRCLLKRVFKEIVNIAFLTSVRLRTRQLQNITARGLTSRPKGQSHDESASKIAPTPCR